MVLVDFIDISVACAAVFCIIVLYKVTRRREGVPPGPPCWPIVGNLGSLVSSDPLKSFSNLRKTYGDIYGIYIDRELHIVLNGYDVIHSALVKRGTLFSKRPENDFVKLYHVEREHDLLMGSGTTWKTLRTFILNSLNDLCFSKNSVALEKIIQTELQFFTDRLLKSLKDPVDLSPLISCGFANVMFCLLHGRRLGYDNEQFNEYLHSSNESVRRYTRDQLMHSCFPFLYWLPGDILHLEYRRRVLESHKSYFTSMLKPNIENYTKGDRNCIIDYWLENKPEDDDPNEPFHLDYLLTHVADLMTAGTETSATTLEWLLLCISLNSDIQAKLYSSIISVIGKDCMPSVKDKNDLPYVQASILEALRIGNIAPLAIPHSVPHDVNFNGFIIPKDCTVLPNLASVHMDADIFPQPEVFRPERFLNEDETKLIYTEKLIPFSVGPRSCVGETVARTELFLFVTSLLQKFEFQLPEGSEKPTLKGVFGITHRPQNCKLKIVKRA